MYDSWFSSWCQRSLSRAINYLSLVYILTLNIHENYSFPFTGDVSPVQILGPRKEFRYWEPWKKMLSLASFIPLIKVRFMQEKIRTMKWLYHAFCTICLDKWFMFEDWPDCGRSNSHVNLCSVALVSFYQLSKYYRDTIKLKYKMWILGVLI